MPCQGSEWRGMAWRKMADYVVVCGGLCRNVAVNILYIDTPKAPNFDKPPKAGYNNLDACFLKPSVICMNII